MCFGPKPMFLFSDVSHLRLMGPNVPLSITRQIIVLNWRLEVTWYLVHTSINYYYYVDAQKV